MPTRDCADSSCVTDYRGPGEGAEEVASRAARRAARLRREREIAGATDSAAEAELQRALRTQKNWSQGAEGERLVAHTLGALERYGWLLLHDIRWPGRQKANIDHVAIGPGGVLVIDTKYWNGAVTVADSVLRCDGYSKAKECDSIALQAADVTALLRPEHRSSVRGVMALAAHETEPSPAGPITVMGREHLGPWLLGLPARLNPFDVVEIATQLRTDHGSRAAGTPARQHGAQQRVPRERPRALQKGARPDYPGSATQPNRRSRVGCAMKVVAWFLALFVALPMLINYGPMLGEFIANYIGQVAGASPTPTSTG